MWKHPLQSEGQTSKWTHTTHFWVQGWGGFKRQTIVRFSQLIESEIARNQVKESCKCRRCSKSVRRRCQMWGRIWRRVVRGGENTGEEAGSVCGKQGRAHSSSTQTHVRSAVRLSYDGFSSVCILHGILTASVISWNARGIFPSRKHLARPCTHPLSHTRPRSLRGLIWMNFAEGSQACFCACHGVWDVMAQLDQCCTGGEGKCGYRFWSGFCSLWVLQKAWTTQRFCDTDVSVRAWLVVSTSLTLLSDMAHVKCALSLPMFPVEDRADRHMETISAFSQLSGKNLVIDSLQFYPLSHWIWKLWSHQSNFKTADCKRGRHTHTHTPCISVSAGSSSAGRPCPAGCATCSALNGCLSCKPRLFFHLELDGMRQRGTCLSSCPRGHYGTRSQHISTCTSRYQRGVEGCFNQVCLILLKWPYTGGRCLETWVRLGMHTNWFKGKLHPKMEMNTAMLFCCEAPGLFCGLQNSHDSLSLHFWVSLSFNPRECWENKVNINIVYWPDFLWPAGCKEDCASCFSENFCTHCHPGHFLFRGKCEISCPNGLTANAALRECTGETPHSALVHSVHVSLCMWYWNEVFRRPAAQ